MDETPETAPKAAAGIVVLLMTEIRVDAVIEKSSKSSKCCFRRRGDAQMWIRHSFHQRIPRKSGCSGLSSAGPRDKRQTAAAGSSVKATGRQVLFFHLAGIT
jgi:hypothetical protein